MIARGLGVDLRGAEPVRRATVLPGGARGDLYTPRRGRPEPAVLLAAGVTPAGTEDPRVVRLARAVAHAGRTVFVPRMRLASYHLDEEDVRDLVSATTALDRGHGVVALGFSFGGAFCLIAAADRRTDGHLRAVASFGAYGDLLSFFGAIRDHLEMGIDDIAGLFDDHAPGGLDEADRAVLADVVAGRAEVSALPPSIVELARRLSPVTVADEVRVPVLLLHARGDPTVPDAELRRLAAALPHARLHTVELFRHVDFHATPRQLVTAVRDLLSVWRFAAGVLAA